MDKIPCFGKDKLTIQSYKEVHKYLIQAFESPHHPLGALLTEIATVYTATYGGVRVHPLLLSHAVSELHSITSRIYDIVTLLFPALLRGGKEYVLGSEDDDKNEGYVICRLTYNEYSHLNFTDIMIFCQASNKCSCNITSNITTTCAFSSFCVVCIT